jgi:hypothetical protein
MQRISETAVLNLHPLHAIPQDHERLLNQALADLGVKVVGAQGTELVLEVIDVKLAGKGGSFSERLLSTLRSAAIADVWAHYTSASYN